MFQLKFCTFALLIILLIVNLSSSLPLTIAGESFRSKRSILDHFNSIQRNGVPTVPITFGGRTSSNTVLGRGVIGSIYVPGQNLTEQFFGINETIYSTIDFNLKPEDFNGMKLSELTIKINTIGIPVEIPIYLHGGFSIVQDNSTSMGWIFINSTTPTSGNTMSFQITSFLNTLKSLTQNKTHKIHLTLQLRRRCPNSNDQNLSTEERCKIFHPQKTLIDNYIRMDYFSQRRRKQNRSS